LSQEVNEGVERAHREGILTAASLMVGGAAADDAMRRARLLPSLRVGLHLVLVDGRPVLPPERIPHLVAGDGRLRSDLAMAGIEMFVRPSARRELAAEIEAQFAAYHATGLPLDHVDAHHHFHLHPTVCAQVLTIGRRYGMKALRVPREPGDIVRRLDTDASHRRGWLTGPWVTLLARRVRRHGLTAPQRVFGLAWSGAMTEERIARLLQNLPEGLTEIYCHPAVDVARGAASGCRGTDELAALIAPGVKQLLLASGARTGGFADFASS